MSEESNNKDELTSHQQGAYTRMVNSFRDNTNALLEEVRQAKQEINDFYIKLLKGNDNQESLKDEIIKSKNSIIDNEEKIVSKYNEISEYYNTIFETDKEDGGLKEKLDELYNSLFIGNDDEASLKEQIQTLFTDNEKILSAINETKEKVNTYHKELLIDTDNEQSIKTQIQISKNDIENSQKSIGVIKDELQIFYEKIKGTKDENGKLTGSLEQEIKDKFKGMDEGLEKADVKYTELFDRIEKLLSGATTVGLAQAFAEERRKFTWPNVMWSILFIISMLGMFAYGYLNIDVTNVKSFEDAISRVLPKIPVFFPLIWLAIYAGKQQSQNKRLAQEYAHKESVARSYEGYKKEIEKLTEGTADGTEKVDIRKKLIQSIIIAFGYNPSVTLDNLSHKEEPPFVTWVNKIMGRNNTNENKP